MQIYKEFGIDTSRFVVARILCQNFKKLPNNDDPSWLTLVGHTKDSLWSVDLFRCESIQLKSYWVMLVIDIYSRRIIGFSVHTDNLDGIAVRCMFNKIIVGRVPPKRLSSGNDPLFESHPFIERSTGLCRQELLNHVFFWNAEDLTRKLGHYQNYHNETRAHSSLDRKTPNQKATDNDIPKK